MSDINKVKDLHEQRCKLDEKIRAHGDAPQDTEEWKTTWDEMLNDYNNILDELESANNEVALRDEIEKTYERMSEDANRLNTPNFGPGPLSDEGPVTPSKIRDMRKNAIENNVLSMHAWYAQNVAYRPDMITDEHRAALRATNANLSSPEFSLRLHDTYNLRNLQRQWQMTGGRRYLNAQVEGTPSKGGFTVGETLVGNLERALLDFSGILQVADIIRTSNGEPFRWPTVDDTSNKGTLVGESTDAGTATDITMGQVVWYAETFTSGQLYVSRDLMQDSIFNWENVLGELLGERIGRKQNEVYTTGSGAGITPRGITLDSVLGVTTASSSAIAFDEVYDLENSVDHAYLSNARFMMHRSIMNVVRKLKDGNGNYLWHRGTEAGTPDMLIGYPVVRNADMASSVASTNKTILFGDLSKYKVRQVNDVRIQKLIERRAEFNQDSFIAYARGDGKLLNAGTNPVKHMVH